MNLLLHAITPLDAAADTPLAGLREQPLVRVDEQGLAAWATEFREAPDQLTRTDLLSHHDLVTRLDERRRLQAESAEQVVATLREIASDVYLEPLPSDTVERPLVRASLLVSRADEAGFIARIERLQADWPEPVYRLMLSGPWPPYRFGGLQPGDAR